MGTGRNTGRNTDTGRETAQGTHAPGSRHRTLATVCLPGTLEEKLRAASGAGFDGVELFEPDLLGCALAPEHVRAFCGALGLAVDLYQPLGDFDSRDPARFADNLRRATAKSELTARLGCDTLLVCSSTASDAAEETDRIAEQLHQLAARAADSGLRVAYEALAWGRYVHTWQRAWEIVRAAGHPALGLCLDSFHALTSRTGDTSGIRHIDPEHLFFVQLADAPRPEEGLRRWSRHHRLLPGQGELDVAGFLAEADAAGYRGPLSLEVFNDVFRQGSGVQLARDAMRSLLAVGDAAYVGYPGRAADAGEGPQRGGRTVPAAPEPVGHGCTVLAVDDRTGPRAAAVLRALGFSHTAAHRTEPLRLFEQGAARVLLDGSGGGAAPHTAAGARLVACELTSAAPEAALARARALLAPVAAAGPPEDAGEPASVVAPGGLLVRFRSAADAERLPDGFVPAEEGPVPPAGLTRTDHLGLALPFDRFDAAVLFWRTVPGLVPQPPTEAATPAGPLTGRALAAPGRGPAGVRLALHSIRRGPGAGSAAPYGFQRVAFASDDIFATAVALRRAGAPVLPVPVNHHDDLDARLGLPPALSSALRDHAVLYERDAAGAYFRLCTPALGGRVSLEVVQRVGEYRGCGAAQDPVVTAALLRYGALV
ncbi:sugar phosphate isomerase/epimerase and 4-hydroxyphenylpyruvate domain-containing protein [Streptomyces cacaoi]|uniref:sugar phosphate isomerase/epimerase and 4-hydroxyphenylpyruvate domain-containing protein n=1 Tax=Streptomyces cacaoi TaxID=1898 RepID=UPI0011F310EE|nr:sugar phosphate isomerase/epimerase and 4-hydroxyphenylpyruvate domain-containing protein [Streptomyces cacaoi]